MKPFAKLERIWRVKMNKLRKILEQFWYDDTGIDIDKAEQAIRALRPSKKQLEKTIQNSKLYFEYYVMTDRAPGQKQDDIKDLADAIYKLEDR